MTNSFISNYKYHTLTCSFSPTADSQTIDIIIDYLNTNPLFTELKLRKMNSFSDRIESNEKAINQIDAIILKYTNEISNSSNTDSQLYVDNKDIRPNDLIKTKIELSKEIEILKEEKIFILLPYITYLSLSLCTRYHIFFFFQKYGNYYNAPSLRYVCESQL